MENRKHILFVISYLDKGGAERALSNITNNAPEDWDIDILVNNDKVIDYEYNANIISMNLGDSSSLNSLFFQVGVLFKRIKKLRELKKNGDYDAVISFLDSANFANILSGKRCRVIISARCSLDNVKSLKYRLLVDPLISLLYNRADKVVAVSRELAKELVNNQRISPEKIAVIENGYNVEEIKRLACEPIDEDIQKMIEHRPMIFTAGRLSNQKYHWHLIRAMSKVVEIIPDTILLIAGEGELKEYLQELITVCGLTENVKLLGFVSNVYAYEKLADAFVFPSGWEGFPNALAEAMCVGTPCIASDFKTGAKELLAPEKIEMENSVIDVSKETYGIMTPICSGIHYSGMESLEKTELFLAEAIIDMLSNESIREEYHKNSLIRGESFKIEDILQKWNALVENK